MNPQIADAPTHIEGYSNLTAAILAQAPIDWAQLDGQKILCVNEAIGTLKGTMKRDYSKPLNSVFAWWDEYMDGAYIHAFLDAWKGRGGWSIWIGEEVPMRAQAN